MMGELLRIGGVLAFTVLLLLLRELFLSGPVRERRKANEECFKD
jgi:hypothetical protein